MSEENDGLGYTLRDNFVPIEENKEEALTEETPVAEEKTTEEETPVAEEKKEEETPDDNNPEEKPKEETPEEEKQEEVPAEEEKLEEETPKEGNPEEVPERSLNNISELTDGEFESPEQLLEAYNKQRETVSGKTIMEALNAKVQEVHGEDYTYADLVNHKSINFDEMDPMKILAEYEEMKDPDIEDHEIKSALRPYSLLNKSKEELEDMIEDGEITQEDIDDLRAKFSTNVRKARKELKDFQDSIDIDNFEVFAPQQKTEEPAVDPETQKLEFEYYDAVISEFGDQEVQVGSDENPHSLNLSVSDEDRNGIKEFVSGDWIKERWGGEDGIINMDQLAKDVNKIINHDRNVKIAFQQGKTAGGSEEVKEINNINFEKGETPKTEKTSQRSQYAEEVRKANS